MSKASPRPLILVHLATYPPLLRWDVLFLGWNNVAKTTRTFHCSEDEPPARCGCSALCLVQGPILDTTAYVVHRRLYEALIRRLSLQLYAKAPLLPVDVEMALFFASAPATKVFAVMPEPIVGQNRLVDSEVG